MNTNERKHYDVGIVGWWYGINYGTACTYFGLYEMIKSIGFSPIMIYPPSEKYIYVLKSIEDFCKKNYNITQPLKREQLSELNTYIDSFMLGSDQLWNYKCAYSHYHMLDFAGHKNKRLAYATSFGHTEHYFPPDVLREAIPLMQKFTAVSVRETSALKITKEVFGVDSDWVLDPVLACGNDAYDRISEDAVVKTNGDFLFAYILDPDDKKKEIISTVAEILELKTVTIVDRQHKNTQKLEEMKDYNPIKDVGVEEFVYHFKNAKFVVTDSFHGFCMSIKYNIQFLGILNKFRGNTRFETLINLFGLKNIFSEKLKLQNLDFKKMVNYKNVNKILNEKRKSSLDWLKSAIKSKILLESKHPAISSSIAHNISADTERCRIIVSLIKQFGIKHIVISAGTRNITFDRLFEYNKDWFKVYYVTDERSAGYFAIGLATKLQETVCLCCTSGTAVCNYVPPLTEALYQKVPLLVLTSDRYPGLHERQEQQTIDQISILNGSVKKVFTIIADENDVKPRLTACTVSEALLEINDNGAGPVQLNVPIKKFDRYNAPEYSLILPKTHFIPRIHPDNGDQLVLCVDELKEKKQILVVLNQQNPPKQDLKDLFNQFAQKYNCVLYVDYFANLQNDYTVFHSEEQLTDRSLAPDLLITFGEERANMISQMNTFDCKKHWRVNEDGKFCNKFYILNKVFKMSASSFLKYFVDNAGDIKNNNNYLQKIREDKSKIFKAYAFAKWEMKYTIGCVITHIPENSLLHLSRSLTVRFAHQFQLPKGVEVYCNAGTNGIDGSASAFMGQVAVAPEDQLCFLMIGDLTFFYDMNSLWNKKLSGNVRILLNNNGGAGLLRHHRSMGAEHPHATVAKGWVESLGFRHLSAITKEEFDKNLPLFLSKNINEPIFFEVILPSGE